MNDDGVPRRRRAATPPPQALRPGPTPPRRAGAPQPADGSGHGRHSRRGEPAPPPPPRGSQPRHADPRDGEPPRANGRPALDEQPTGRIGEPVAPVNGQVNGQVNGRGRGVPIAGDRPDAVAGRTGPAETSRRRAGDSAPTRVQRVHQPSADRLRATGPGRAGRPVRRPDPDERPTEVVTALADRQATALVGAGAKPRAGSGWPAAPPPRPPAAARRRTAAAPAGKRPTFGRALLATAASTVVPGTGLLMVRRTRAGALALGIFLLAVAALLIVGFTVKRTALVTTLLSSRVLLIAAAGLALAGVAWIAQIVRTYTAARPRRLAIGQRITGVLVVAALCLVVAAPFGYAANLVNTQRSLLDTLFSGNGGGTAADVAITKPRINVLMVGSDAGPDRTGARTDTMMVASIDTHTARTTLFGLPRNIGYAEFPPGTPLAEKFPRGFHDPNGNPLSGDYLLNAIYPYALAHPELAPAGPTKDPGLNALQESVAYMMGIDLDYYVDVNMAGFASIIDAVGGVTVDVGPVPLPIGGVLPDGTHVRPQGYVPAGVHHLDGTNALWYARSRRDSDDYNRMGRQRCLLQSLMAQKSPTDIVTNFQAIASATTNSVSTNVPQPVLAQLVALVGEQKPVMQSVTFDPNLPDPDQPDGHFDPSHPNVPLMRQVVQQAFAVPPASTAPSAAAPTPTRAAQASAGPRTDGTQIPANSTSPEALATSCQ